MAKLVFGCGYLGLRVARRWAAEGHRVVAVTRSPQRAAELAAMGLCPQVADVTEPASLVDLPLAESVLYAVGYDRTSGKSMAQVYVDGLRHALDALSPATGRILYISSTGVYGQEDGQWVEETSPCYPHRDGGRICLAAEHALTAHTLGEKAVILRMAGLYGPGRIPRRQELLEGRTIVADEGSYLNLIHVADAAEAVLAAERHAPLPSLYNITDGHPVLRGDYFRELARLVGAPPPRFARPQETDTQARAQRGASDKRVSNAKMRAELPLKLHYPTYRAGLAAILADQTPHLG